jgi:hypothetical protein
MENKNTTTAKKTETKTKNSAPRIVVFNRAVALMRDFHTKQPGQPWELCGGMFDVILLAGAKRSWKHHDILKLTRDVQACSLLFTPQQLQVEWW